MVCGVWREVNSIQMLGRAGRGYRCFKCLQVQMCNESWEQREDECGGKKSYRLAQGHLMLFRGKIG